MSNPTPAPAPPNAPNAPPPLDPEVMRRDMQAMLSFIQGARIVSMARETAVSQIQGWLLRRYVRSILSSLVMLGVIVLVCRSLGLAQHIGFLCGLVLLLFVARCGALISIGRRIKDDDVGKSVDADAIYALATLGSGINGLAIALMSSNAFGLVMYALFASGLPATLGLTGGIAPTFRLSVGELHARMVADQQDASDKAALVKRCRAAPPSPAPSASASPDSGADEDAPASANQSAAAPAPAEGDTTGNVVEAPATPSCDELQTAAEAAALTAKVSVAALAAALPPQGRKALDPGGQDSILDLLCYGLGLAQASDLFKMLIWAFIAGFFETLVPDMLDALAKRGREKKP